MNNKNVVAIIPARGGSKSIPRKNIKLLGGHPLIAYSIAAAKESKLINKVIVSTDDKEIAMIARQYGADVPFMRPVELAQDHVMDMPVFQHAINWLYKSQNLKAEIIVQLRPTSPFRPAGLIDKAIKQIIDNEAADSLRCVTASGQNPYKMWFVENDKLAPIMKTDFFEPYNMPRQELPSTFWQTGHLDIIRYNTIANKKSLTGDTIIPCFIDPKYSIDLDTPQQWELAEYFLRYGELDIVQPIDPWYQKLKQAKLLVMDFDGVMTDNLVQISENNIESVTCSREDGMGLALLEKNGIPVIVLSTEKNTVVTYRCQKLNIECFQGVSDKKEMLTKIVQERNITFDETIYIGNDINDLDCLSIAGLAVVVNDAKEDVKKVAHMILDKKGGQGAVRELCDMIISAKKE